MKAFKRLVMRVLLCVEIVVFAGFYMWGAQGMACIRALEEENAQVEHANIHLQSENAKLEHTIITWHNHPFEKERIARTKLQMARPGDQIFYIS